MKKIVRGIFLGILAVVIIAASVGAYVLFHGKNPNDTKYPYVVDNEGNSYLAVEGNDGVTYAVVTDASGNRYAAQINSDGSIGVTLGNVNAQVALEDLPTNYTGEKIDESVNVNDFTGNASELPDEPSEVDTATVPDNSAAVTEPSSSNAGENTSSDSQGGQTSTSNASTPKPTDPTQQTKPTEGSTAPDKLTAYRIEKYQKIFANGTYLMEFTTNDPELGDTPITAAMKNGNFIIDTSIQNYKCKMLYIAKDKTTYLIIDDFKKYCKLPEDLMGEDMDMTSMMDSFATADVPKDKIKVKEVVLGGKKLICESYKLKDGSETRFYFDGETLVRRDNINTDGTTDSTYISRITSDVPDSTFEIPKNYGYLNLSWLGL